MPAPANLVHQQSTTTGAGNLTLTTVNGKQSFDTPFGHAGTPNVFDYFISNQGAVEWERGTGHLSDASTLVRDTVLEGTNGASAVNFSAGIKDVSNDVPAAHQVTTDTAQTISGIKTFSSPPILPQLPAFYATLSADQTGIASATNVLINFDTVHYDVGSHFASHGWTPIAGLCMFVGSLYTTGTISAGNNAGIALVKNGSTILLPSLPCYVAIGGSVIQVVGFDRANGTDVYTLSGNIATNSGTGTFRAGANTYFQGVWLSQ